MPIAGYVTEELIEELSAKTQSLRQKAKTLYVWTKLVETGTLSA